MRRNALLDEAGDGMGQGRPERVAGRGFLARFGWYRRWAAGLAMGRPRRRRRAGRGWWSLGVTMLLLFCLFLPPEYVFSALTAGEEPAAAAAEQEEGATNPVKTETERIPS